jgi:hypothetical protein
MNEALTLLETNREKLEDGPKLEGSPGPDGSPNGVPTPLGSPEDMPLAGATPLGSPSLDDGDDDEMMEFYPDMSSDEESGDDAKAEPKAEPKEEIKEEKLIKEEELKEEKVEIKEEPPAKLEKAAIEISLDSDDDDAGGNVIDSEDSVHDVDSGLDDSSDAVYEDISSGASSEVEEVDCSFKTPAISASLTLMMENFVFRCLGTLFMHRGPMWARPKIDSFFQDVYYRKSIFTERQQGQIEAWQARIKVMQKGGERDVGEANNPMEAHRPVIDSRETINAVEADGGAWAAKQTFDSRDRAGGSRVIR